MPRMVQAARPGQLRIWPNLEPHRHPHLGLQTRAWNLRANITPYDAMYVALAEALDTPAVTCDVPLARSPGPRARIDVIE